MKVAICSNSLGLASAGHRLEDKLKAAKAAGIQGIELAMECLLEYAQRTCGAGGTASDSWDSMREAAKKVRALADNLALERYDALHSKTAVDARLEELSQWSKLCVILGAKFILIFASCTWPLPLSDLDTDDATIIGNMQKAADLLALDGITIGYEAPAWGIKYTRWQDIHRSIAQIRRPNVKHCLDTFHVAAVECHQPPTMIEGGLTAQAAQSLQESLRELRTNLKGDDIGWIQLSDALPYDRPPPPPANNAHMNVPGQLTWCENYRTLPMRGDGILPVPQILDAMLETGYTGWLSFEIFHPDLSSSDPATPFQVARAAEESWNKLKASCARIY